MQVNDKHNTNCHKFPSVEVKQFNGTPTLFLDGEPAFFASMWSWGEHTEDMQQTADEAGIHIYCVRMGVPDEWFGPGEGHTGHFDFSNVKERLESFLEADSQARFLFYVNLEMETDWWEKLYPQECEVTSLGRQREQSYASQVWREESKDFLRALIDHIKIIGMEERVIAYDIMTGHAGEWVKRSSSMGVPCGDYSDPMRRHFQAYLRERYNEDVFALRDAWSNPEITFDTAEVPSAGEQLQTTDFIFRDPAREQNVIDYYRCLADLSR